MLGVRTRLNSLRTHPVSVSRISEAKNRAENMPKSEPSDGRDFYLVQARLRAMIEEYPYKALEFFNHRIDRAGHTSQAESDSLFLRLGNRLAAQRRLPRSTKTPRKPDGQGAACRL